MFKMCKKCMCNNFVRINSLKTLFNWKYGRYAINLSNILRYACNDMHVYVTTKYPKMNIIISLHYEKYLFIIHIVLRPF